MRQRKMTEEKWEEETKVIQELDSNWEEPNEEEFIY